jgi:multidrug efflux pump subunit AcrA (membrane-fusion protein)
MSFSPALVLCAGLLWSACGDERSRGAEVRGRQASAPGDASPGADEGLVLSPESRALAELTTVPVRYEMVRDRTHATGEIQVNGRRVARVVSRMSGWVEEVRRIRGDRVRSGDVVLTIYSPEYQTAGRELLSARARLVQAMAKADSAEVETARAIYTSARKRLLLFGETEAEVDTLLRAGDIDPIVHIPSPFDGTIIENSMVQGHRVEAGTEVCFISDLRTVWAILNVLEKDLASVRVGSAVSIRVGAYPGQVFAGEVTFVDNIMDEGTRTVRVRVEVANRDGRLKPGMFVDGDIDRGSERQGLVVPSEAVQQEGASHFVFVDRNGRFYRRDVQPGVEFGAVFEIRGGLAAGDTVVVGGAFILKSEMLKASFGEEGD